MRNTLTDPFTNFARNTPSAKARRKQRDTGLCHTTAMNTPVAGGIRILKVPRLTYLLILERRLNPKDTVLSLLWRQCKLPHHCD
eukprot:2446254-Ditylum_brightwellii.AAC.1